MQIAAPSGWKRNGKHSRFTAPNPTVTQRNADMIELAKRSNVLELAKRYTTLCRVSAHEWAGPCPKCGGSDRLHITETWWFCAKCSESGRNHRGNAIDFVLFVTGWGFKEAVDFLAGDLTFGGTPAAQPVQQAQPNRPPAQTAQTAQWRERAAAEANEAHERLLNAPEGEAQREYLLRRALQPATWAAYQLGAGLAHNQDDGQMHQCVTIPWMKQGEVGAIRYRFIAPVGKTKVTSRQGSVFSERLWGGQALLGVAEQHRTLVLCEGELNAASIWQVGHALNFDVLSLGSESQRVTEAMFAYASRFRQVIVWMDKAEKVQELCGRLANAVGIPSPDGQDANDFLRSGGLQVVLCEMRLRGCRDDHAREGLLWDIYDADRDGLVDEYTRAFGIDLAGKAPPKAGMDWLLEQQRIKSGLLKEHQP